MVAEVEKRTTEIPCPPEQVLPEKVMFVPLLMAKQSSAHRKCRMLRQLLHIKYMRQYQDLGFSPCTR
jgi:hypothetical protein